MRMVEFARSNRLPFTWHDTEPARAGAWTPRSCRSCGCRAASSCADRRPARSRARSGSAASWRPGRRSTWSSSAAVPPASAPRSTARPRVWRRSSSRAPRSAGRRASSRRIENYLGFPAGITGSELTSRAVTQARKFNARTATPYRAVSLEPSNGRYVVRLEENHEIVARTVLIATGAQYRRLPGRGALGLRGAERVLCGRAAGGPAVRRLARRRGRRRQLGRPGRRLARPRRRARDAAPSPRRSARDDVGLPRARARAQRRRGSRSQRDRRAARRRRPARGRHADDAASTCPSRSCSSSSARLPCTEWLGDVVARDDKGFILTGAAAGADALLETSLPGVFAAGDVRSGSTKRCATAVGEGAMAVQFVHGRLAQLAGHVG